MSSVIKVVIVTNVPPPYRIPVWQRVARAEGINLDLIFCAPAYIDTSLDPADYGFSKHFLKAPCLTTEQHFMHCDLGVWSLLNQLQPDVVITTGYIPTFLFAFVWAVTHRVPHVAMTDGTTQSEKSLSWLHRLVRRIVLGRSAAFVGASEGSCNIFRQYGVAENRIHKSYLCADNERFSYPPSDTAADFIFCGRFVTQKRPLFALQVARETAIRLKRRTAIDFVGSGSMEPMMSPGDVLL